MSELNLPTSVAKRSVARPGSFVGSDDGGYTNTVFTSLLASCRMLEVEPWSYLRDLLCLLPRWSSHPSHRLLELAPVNRSRTREQDEVRGLLNSRALALTLLGDPPSAA